MPALFTFLFKVNIALVLFCLGYYLVLRRLTFYILNRIYLVTAILFSSLYPCMNINNFVQRHQQLTSPVQNVIIRWKAPAENLVKPLEQHNYWYWAGVVFWIGVVLLAARLIIQLISLHRLHKHSQPGEVHNYAVRLINGDVSPFSFWRNIYINPEKLSKNDLEKVLEHEYIHVKQWHTLDILLAELSTVFYWFNPGIWLMKKAVKENIEFITDRKILQKGADSKQYQYSLLNVSMAGTPNNLVNNFNISTIKKRIIMMNARRSSRFSLTRYMVIVPAVILLLLVFSISKAAIAKKGIFPFHIITAAINNVAIVNNDKPVIRAHKPLELKAKAKFRITAKGDTIYAGKSKDGKKTMLITSDKTKDSVGYVINGAKSTRSDLEALDPGKVYSLDMVPADQAKKYVDFTLDKPEILFVTTDDSEKGKTLKERMDKDMDGGVLVRGRNFADAASDDIAPPPPPPGGNYSIATTTVTADVAPRVSVHGNVKADTKVTRTYKITGVPKTSTTTSVIVLPDGTKKVMKDVYVIKGAPDDAVVMKDDGADRVRIVGRNGDVKHLTYKVDKLDRNSDETTIDDFNKDVLYVVNGKVVKSLKGVSAADISSISVLKDEAATKKYGDKGKNGVIEVTTKK